MEKDFNMPGKATEKTLEETGKELAERFVILEERLQSKAKQLKGRENRLEAKLESVKKWMPPCGKVNLGEPKNKAGADEDDGKGSEDLKAADRLASKAKKMSRIGTD